MKLKFRIPILILLFLFVLNLHSQTPFDIDGTWSVQTTADVPGSFAGVAPRGESVGFQCIFDGTAVLTQAEDDSFSGDINVSLTTGPVGCPAIMSGMTTGQQNGTLVEMGMIVGSSPMGNANYMGDNGMVPLLTAKLVGAGTMLSGTFVVTAGPFNVTGGTWTAIKQPGVVPTFDVPFLGTGGLVLLALLLVAGYFWLLPR